MQKLSVVVSSRNDDYIKDNIDRIKSYISDTRRAFNQFEIEFVFVEYNNPENNPHLYEEVKDKNIRWIIVNNEFHNKVSSKPEFDMNEYMAKNIGCRRANGDFLLVGSPDVRFPRDFSLNELSNEVLYLGSKHHVTPDGRVRYIKPATTNGAIGDFLIIDKKSFFGQNGFSEDEVRGVCDTVFAENFVKSGGKVCCLGNFIVWHVDHHVNISDSVQQKRDEREKSRKIIKRHNLKMSDENWGAKGISFKEECR